jgi:hypothetical protein
VINNSSPQTHIAGLEVRREADDHWRACADKTFESFAEDMKLLARIEAQNTHLAAKVGHLRKEVAASQRMGHARRRYGNCCCRDIHTLLVEACTRIRPAWPPFVRRTC